VSKVGQPSLESKVAFLGRPESYPERPRKVEVRETHMSWVFLTDEHVFKLKKPVRWDELDHSTLALRRRDCEAEVRLNRRLAPEVYRGTLALKLDRDGRLHLGGRGRTVEWLVWMRRLPADSMLDAAIRSGRADRAAVDGAARLLARFWASASSIELTPEDYCRRLRDGVHGDVAELSRPDWCLPPDVVRGLGRRALAWLDDGAALLERRVRDGRIVEGHGDLRPEHVCLAPEPAVIDCLEFSRELRLLDPADELAFLDLECRRLGAPEVGGWFLAVYSGVTGDSPAAPLLRFHRVYRALRRAKIAVWHLRDDAVTDPGRWRERAQGYLSLGAREVA
jgi:uncharacterized protein